MRIGILKLFLSLSLVLFSSIISLLYSKLTLDDNKATLQWIADGQASKNPRYYDNYTKEYINNFKYEVDSELKLATQIRTISVDLSLISGIFIVLLLFFKPYYWQK